jgi:16S rRNA (guanine527-N7)-methyltransferase
MAGRFDTLIDRELDVLGGAPSEVGITVARWLDALVLWNEKIDLTAARTDAELCDLMLADAVILAKQMRAGARVIDVGTGAGAPGLAIALLRPDVSVTLVEPLGKRAAFLRTAIGLARREDIVLLREKGERVAKRSPRGWDIAISRATLGAAEWVPLGLELATTTWALLAREEPPEVPGARIDIDLDYSWPLTSATRRAVRYVRS